MKRLPPWLIKTTPKQANIRRLRALIPNIHTVCESAKCPNVGECYSRGTLTFMILGDICTRNCAFCGVTNGTPGKVDAEEPEKIVEAARRLALKYVVVTSVTRDDLPDGGAGHFARVIKALNRAGVRVEVLIPDLGGDERSIRTVIDAGPFVINHNLETVPRLYPAIRPRAQYRRSLDLLKFVKGEDNIVYTKSGIMVGLGEREEEVIGVLGDLANVKCDAVTIGQYLPPSRSHASLVEYVHPSLFERYAKTAKEMGFLYVASGPFVRSSYQAEKLYEVQKS
ncbi:MAG: lipoyl synthase [Gammaproteobacteria bacterium]|nr:lipoyl synthase [Gammaproteobacteria bacterium]